MDPSVSARAAGDAVAWPHATRAMTALSILGFVFELVGLSVAAVGFYRTVQEVAPDQRPWSAVIRRAKDASTTLVARVTALVGRILRRRRDVTVAIGATALGTATVRGRVSISYGPLGRLWDHEGALRQLHARTIELRKMIEDEHFARTESEERLDTILTELESRLGVELRQVRDERRSQALSDSQWQFGGLLLVIVGLVLNTIGQTFR